MQVLIWTIDLIMVGISVNTRGKFFCSQSCEHDWLNEHMECIEQGRPIEFIRHRRESQGYHKVRTDESRWISSRIFYSKG
jgi:hypothetical protein